MSNYPRSNSPDSHPDAKQSNSSAQSSLTPLRCFTGALISAPIAVVMYLFTSSISHTFAAKPLTASSALAIRISIMVRTLVIGMSALGTVIFAFTTVGVVALGIQLWLKSCSSDQV